MILVALTATYLVGQHTGNTQTITEKVIVEKTSPSKVITKTVTKQVTNQVKVYPDSCVEAMDLTRKYYTNIQAYERKVGEFKLIQNEAVKAMFSRNITLMNKSDQGLKDLEAETIAPLESLTSDKEDLYKKISECQRSLGK